MPSPKIPAEKTSSGTSASAIDFPSTYAFNSVTGSVFFLS
jgi:hypothetical protein